MKESLEWQLKEGESVLWQGRPAPRCYTFRHWVQALIGSVLFLASSFWLMVGVQLIRAENYSWWLLPVPILLVLGSFLVGPVQLIMARLRWEKIYYALTDQRLLIRNSLFGRRVCSYPIKDYRSYKTKKYGKKLLSLRLSFHNSKVAILECIEYPELFLDHLPKAKSS